MAGASFQLDIDTLGSALSKMMKQVQHTGPMMAEIGDALVSSTKLRFNREAGPDGEKWEPSARAKDTGDLTLTDYATLKNSINYEATKTLVVVGSNVVYAHAHQAGSDVGRGLKVKLPERPYLGFDDDDMEEVGEIIKDHLTSGI